ncbi:MAG TPA: hypothetical protein DD629_07800 [Treponema sp.]|nr:hypothetical protein [Treponema sp.]
MLIPPIFADKGTYLSEEFSFSVLAEFFIAAILQFQFKIENKCKKKSANEKFIWLVNSLKWSALTLGFLMLIFAAVHAFSFAFKVSSAQTEILLKKPENVLSWAFLIFTLAAGAFFEEVLYRQFVPETLNSLLEKWKIPVEIFSVVIFALAHRYLRWISVCNAAFCGAVLRLCRIKTASIAPSFAAHFIYNLSLVVFSVLL